MRKVLLLTLISFAALIIISCSDSLGIEDKIKVTPDKKDTKTSPTENIIDTIDFGTLSLGDTKYLAYTTYTADVKKVINSITIGGPEAYNFLIEPKSFPIVLQKGNGFAIKIIFKPTSLGNKEARMIIKSDVGEEVIILIGKSI